MSTCNNCNCSKTKCTCDSYLTTPPACPSGVGCPTPEICSEFYNMCCVVYNGPTIVDLNPFIIETGDTLCNIMEKYILDQLGGCVDPTGTCLATTGLSVSNVTSSAITVSWTSNPTAVNYQLSVATSLAGPYTSPNVATTLLTDTLIGLTANTEYYIRVVTACASGGPCNSVTIRVRTLNS